MPPGPFISQDPKVVALLDGKSFPVLFDVTKVEKKDLFTGTYMPSTDLTGGYRILSYLDLSEPKHAMEIGSAIRSNGGKLTMAAMEQMPLMKSVVYEALRIEPPVPLQFGRAKKDFLIESHDAAFEVKEGEMLFGFQLFATKDPKIFERAQEFVPDRFIGDNGEKLLKHVLWSNGPENQESTVGNKQCAGKDFVVLMSRLLVVELFRHYSSFEIEVGKSALGVY